MNTKPEQTADRIRKQILDGVYHIGERLPSERKLADTFHCTQFTISKALSILEEEGLVEKKRGSGNYVRNNRSVVTIAFLTNERDSRINPVWHAIYDALNVLTATSNIHYILCVISQTTDEIPSFKLESADIIISAIGLREPLIEKILRLNKPVIWLEEFNRELPGITISFDNYQAGALAAEHLFEQGCRNLAYAQYESYIYPSQRRFEGFQKTLQKKKEYFDLVTYTWFGTDLEAMQRLQNLLKQGNGIDGVFCFADALVPLVIRAAYSMDRRIPDDLAVMGVDGSELSRIFLPSFTTIDQSARQIAEQTFAALTKIMHGEAVSGIQYIEPKLISRDSTMGSKTEQKKHDIPHISVHV